MSTENLGSLKRRFVIPQEEVNKIIQDAMQNGVLFNLRCKAWGNRKKLSAQMSEELFGEDAEAIRAVQDLLDGEQLRDIVGPQRRARTELNRPINSLPWLSTGVHMVRRHRLQHVTDYVERCIVESNEALERFLSPGRNDGPSPYEKAKQDFAEKHPKLYQEVLNSGGYPSPNALREKFQMFYLRRYITFPDEGNVGLLTPEEAAKERAKWKDQLKSVGEETIIMVRKAFAEIFIHLRDTLADPEKRFQESTVEKPKEFLDALGNIPVWGDTPFAELSKKASNLLNGVFAEDLRDDDEYRKLIGKAVNGIVKQFEDLPVVEMERGLDF